MVTWQRVWKRCGESLMSFTEAGSSTLGPRKSRPHEADQVNVSMNKSKGQLRLGQEEAPAGLTPWQALGTSGASFQREAHQIQSQHFLRREPRVKWGLSPALPQTGHFPSYSAIPTTSRNRSCPPCPSVLPSRAQSPLGV